MKLVCLLLNCGLTTIFCSKPASTASNVMDGVSDKMYKALIDRIDQLLGDHQAQIDKLRQDYETEVDLLRHDLRKQKNRISELEAGVHKQEEDKVMSGAHDNIAAPTEQVSRKYEMASTQSTVDKSVGTHETVNTKQNANVESGNSSPVLRMRSVQPGNRIRRLDPEMEVAFYATMIAHQHNLGHNQDIIFEHVIINKGNAYNPHGGIFIAPVAGTYVFSVSLTTYGTHTTHYGLFQNAVQITVLWLNGAQNSGDKSSQTSVLHLAKGDDVIIKHLDNDHDLYGNSHSMFSGFLLYQDFTDGTPAVVG